MDKIKRCISNPIFLLLVWCIFLLTPIAGSLKFFYISRGSNQIDFVRKVLSAIEKSWFIWIILLVISALSVFKNNAKKNTKFFGKILSIVGISSVVSLFASLQLIDKEIQNYPNFVYSTYGFKIGNLETVSTISVLVLGFVIFFFYSSKDAKDKILSKSFLGSRRVIPFIGLVIFSCQVVFPITRWREYIRYTSRSYEDKFNNFIYIEELEKNVPQHGTIILPKQDVIWPDISNPPVVRYFLFPRVLVSSEIDEGWLKKEIKEAYFVQLVNEERALAWPILNSEEKKISFKDGEFVNYSELFLIENSKVNLYKIIF
jgi:hypothetical protein